MPVFFLFFFFFLNLLSDFWLTSQETTVVQCWIWLMLGDTDMSNSALQVMKGKANDLSKGYSGNLVPRCHRNQWLAGD